MSVHIIINDLILLELQGLYEIQSPRATY